jgi:glucan phosphorylase
MKCSPDAGEYKIAYFSMEIVCGLDMPTYSGGFGVSAGDMLRSGADGAVPIVGVTLVHRKGYFRQRLDPAEHPAETARSFRNRRNEGSAERSPELQCAGRMVDRRLSGGVTGWAIGHGRDVPEDSAAEAASLYDKLELVILPMFYGRPQAFADIKRATMKRPRRLRQLFLSSLLLQCESVVIGPAQNSICLAKMDRRLHCFK